MARQRYDSTTELEVTAVRPSELPALLHGERTETDRVGHFKADEECSLYWHRMCHGAALRRTDPIVAGKGA